MHTYTHHQLTPSLTWAINHNLNTTNIALDVIIDINGTREKILPKDFQIVDSNYALVVFSAIRTGTARLIGV